MDKNNNNGLSNAHHGSYEDFLVSQGDNKLTSHNEKRKAQDISKNDLKDSFPGNVR